MNENEIIVSFFSIRLLVVIILPVTDEVAGSYPALMNMKKKFVIITLKRYIPSHFIFLHIIQLFLLSSFTPFYNGSL